jgi:hypothetical protein
MATHHANHLFGSFGAAVLRDSIWRIWSAQDNRPCQRQRRQPTLKAVASTFGKPSASACRSTACSQSPGYRTRTDFRRSRKPDQCGRSFAGIHQERTWLSVPVPEPTSHKLQLVSSMVRHDAVYFRAMCISVRHLCEIQIC